jgi:hypothetical protein
VQTLTADIIRAAESAGLAFARKMGAELYRNSREYLNRLWDIAQFEEIF